MAGKNDMVSVFVGDNAISIQQDYDLPHFPPTPSLPTFLPAFVVFPSLILSLVKEKLTTHM